MDQYEFHYDAGHGWLQVEIAELKQLGLGDKISSCSYTNGGLFAYLEEDCDAPLFMRTKSANGESYQCKEINDGDDSFIRQLPRFTPIGNFV